MNRIKKILIELKMLWILILIIVALELYDHHWTVYNCKKEPMIVQSFKEDEFDHAYWETIKYTGPDNKECATITRRSTWFDHGFSVAVGKDIINMDRGYSLEESEKLIESKYCKLGKE